MSFPYKITAVTLFLFAALSASYWQGLKSGREAALKAAVTAYQTRERINHETDKLNHHALCRALGGLQNECADLMRGVHKTPQAK